MMDREPTKEQKERAVLLENRQWLDANYDKVQKDYNGRYVAVHKNAIAVVTDTPEEMLAILNEKYPINEVCCILVPNEPVMQVHYPF